MAPSSVRIKGISRARNDGGDTVGVGAEVPGTMVGAATRSAIYYVRARTAGDTAGTHDRGADANMPFH